MDGRQYRFVVSVDCSDDVVGVGECDEHVTANQRQGRFELQRLYLPLFDSLLVFPRYLPYMYLSLAILQV